ncbi:MAG TPA: MaoC family dehydratase [Actinomycetota bacterium]|nr:MaoC family dehydratase [Candidatus Nanopelagicales bacterium]HPQ85178.1 MaoC family dehydratase [Actinomycetota bacterium]
MPAFADLAMGQSVVRVFCLTTDDVQAFATISGDSNPVHLDEKYAAASPFGQRIAHGMLSAGYISATIANDLPGPGSIYLSQELKFLAPVFHNQDLTVRLTVIGLREDKAHVTLDCQVLNEAGDVVLAGEALVKAPRI